MKKIAYIVDNEVFLVDDAYNISDRERFESNILDDSLLVIDSTDYPSLVVDSFYKNGFFYSPEDIENNDPLPKEKPIYPEAKYFALIANDIVFRIHILSNRIPPHMPMIAAYSSNPRFVDVTDIENIEIGWVWNGSSFVPSEEG
jgi:hypothetical protein